LAFFISETLSVIMTWHNFRTTLKRKLKTTTKKT